MQIVLAAVGRLKTGPERVLVSRYMERAQAMARGLGISAVCMREVEEGHGRSAIERQIEEARRLVESLPPRSILIALDERGRSLSSVDFAHLVERARDAGTSDFVVVIGGPDGLDGSVRHSASSVVAYGTATFPHQIVRLLAAEQIYRALTILAGHPYHRA